MSFGFRLLLTIVLTVFATCNVVATLNMKSAYHARPATAAATLAGR